MRVLHTHFNIAVGANNIFVYGPTNSATKAKLLAIKDNLA
jgi:hypothetical protein